MLRGRGGGINLTLRYKLRMCDSGPIVSSHVHDSLILILDELPRNEYKDDMS